MSYPEVDGQQLDPKTYVDPTNNTPLPMYVYVLGGVGGGGSVDVSELATQATLAALLSNMQSRPLGVPGSPTTVTNVGLVTTPTLTRATAAGTVPAGAHGVSMSNVGTVNATVLGTILPPGESVHFAAVDRSAPLAAINYVATGTTLVIATTVAA